MRYHSYTCLTWRCPRGRPLGFNSFDGRKRGHRDSLALGSTDISPLPRPTAPLPTSTQKADKQTDVKRGHSHLCGWFVHHPTVTNGKPYVTAGRREGDGPG